MTTLAFGLMVALASVGTATAQAVVNVNAGYSYEMLDPTVDVNRKQLRLLLSPVNASVKERRNGPRKHYSRRDRNNRRSA